MLFKGTRLVLDLDGKAMMQPFEVHKKAGLPGIICDIMDFVQV